ncbi:transposase family protein [Mesorhizobium sp. SB112]|uniref:transposase family protein n=1 Tax=Mesorhizobium sp. SB112 TaxID=3151853 RepID=UPI0032656513
MSTKFRPSDLVPAGFIAERITHIGDETCILLSRAGATASCLACGRMSRTVRSRYYRQVADLPLSGRRVRLLVRTRRFTCDAVLCGRQIFSERFGDVLPSYARRTGRPEHLVHHLALALGGRPAALFAQQLMLPVSNDTLLRVIRRQGLPPSIPPSVIGKIDRMEAFDFTSLSYGISGRRRNHTAYRSTRTSQGKGEVRQPTTIR